MRVLLTCVILGLAWFSAANLAASAISWTAARLVGRQAAPVSASLLLFLRLLPAASAGLLVAVFVPAHLLFEPATSNESFGIVLFVLAALGLALLARTWLRLRRVAALARELRRCSMVPVESRAGDVFEASDFPGVSLAGALRTRILVGSGVRALLTADELDAAVAHEHAHRVSFDNLKRCAMFCAPDVFGFTAAARMLEARWRAEAEHRADISAVAGDARRAMHLASALVKVARFTGRSSERVQPPVWSTFHEPALLETRVRCLVAGPPATAPPGMLCRYVVLTLAAAPAGLWASDALYGIHRATEALIALLP